MDEKANLITKNLKTRKENLIIACGAIAIEVIDILKINNLDAIFDIKCLAGKLHNTPHKIAPLLHQKIIENKPFYKNIIVGFGDCGSKGDIAKVCKVENVNYIKSNHCYEFFCGKNNFEKLTENQITTFFLTDYLAVNFNTLIIKAYKFDKHPNLIQEVFKNYTHLTYLAQTHNDEISAKAKDAADYLGLQFTRVKTGYGELSDFIKNNNN